MKEINCLYCGSNNGDILIEREFPGHKVCNNCGFVFMSQVPDNESNSEFYEDLYWKEHHHFDGIIKDYPVTNRQKSMVEWLKKSLDSSTVKLLEIGCGFGFNLDYLSKNTGFLVQGLEISQAGVLNTEKAFHIKCTHGTLEEYKADEKFQVVVLSHVLEHFENPPEALRIIHGLLELEGYLWVEVPNILAPNPKKTMQNWLAKEHRSYFSMNKLKGMLEHVGFEVVLEEEAHFCRMLAKKAEDSNSSLKIMKEKVSVLKAIRKHYFKNKLFQIAGKLNIELYKDTRA